jgi:DNA-binding GntR family transcriptional regulator
LFDVQKLDPDDPRPQYLQVADAIRTAITSGRLAPGERLPIHADVAADYDVSVGTVKRAFGLLQDEGLIVSRQGQAARVRAQVRDAESPGAVVTGNQGDVRAALAELDRRLSEVEQRLARAQL